MPPSGDIPTGANDKTLEKKNFLKILKNYAMIKLSHKIVFG